MVFAVWVILSASLFAQGPLEQALELARHGQYLKAQAMLKGIPPPDGIEGGIAYFRLKAAVASGLHQPLEAVNNMRAARALAPQDTRLLLATAVVELQAGLTENALADAEASPQSATREALLGDIQEKRGKFVEAVKAYRSAMSLDPGQERYAVALGLELIEHQSFQQAIDSLQRSAAAFQKSAKIRTLLGIAQYGQGYAEEAAASLEDAISLAPGAQAPYAALSRIVLESSAAPTRRTLDCLCPWNRLVCSALQLRMARATGDAALQAEATRALKLAPRGDAIGRCELGRAYEWNGALTKARPELEACVRLDPSPQNHYRLALLYRRLHLPTLAGQELAQRQKILHQMSDETAMGLKALQDLDPPKN